MLPADKASGKTSCSGRPAIADNRNVPESIVQAAVRCLMTKTPQQITTREIAAHAKVRPAMIGYYFGSKEGLLEEILRRSLDELEDGLEKIREEVRKQPAVSPTRAMIAMFAAAHNRHPVLGRILSTETLRTDSPLRRRFLRQWQRVPGNRVLVELMTELAAAGYYRRDINAAGIAKMIRSVVFFPLASRDYLHLENESVENFLGDEWIDFVASVFDSYLMPRK